MAEQRQTFWGWVSENPVTALFALMLGVCVVGLIVGYKDMIMSVITGIFGFLSGDDSSNKIKRLEIAKKNTDDQFAATGRLIEEIQTQQTIHDEEVRQNVENAKAECDEMDTDELVDIGNSMLRDHGVFRGES